MKLTLPTLLLTSMASFPYATARVGQKTKPGQKILKLKSQQPLDPRKFHLAPKQTSEDASEENRIINGENADQGEFPFYVLLGGDGFCGGSLIHEDIILTAAHCNIAISTNTIYIGTYYLDSMVEDEEIQYIETRRIHPNYDELTMVNDVMVIKIDSPSLLPTIALNDDSASPSVGEDVVAIGLGLTTDGGLPSNVLLKVTIPIIAHDQCAADLVDLNPVEEDVMLCAGLQEGGKDTCQGDSGGPLLELRGGVYVQVGITSWGDGCAQPNSPGVYTRVSGVKDWIDEMICDLSDNPPANCSSTDKPKTSQETDKPKTGLFVVLVVAGIAAIGLVAFLLKRRTNRRPQVSPQLGTESAAVVSAIPIEDDGTKAPVKVPEKPSSKVKETLFEDVNSLSDVPINDLGDEDKESVSETCISSITGGFSYPAAGWRLPPSTDLQSEIADDEVSV